MKYNSKKFKSVILYLIGAGALILIDQLTKIAAVNALKGKNAYSIIPGVFEFFYLENDGAAWGMMSGARYWFLIITVIIVAIILFVTWKMPYTKRMLPLRIVTILLSAGAVGNFIDRLIIGYVRDFIYFRLVNFPIFNIADVYVTISVIIFVILILFVYKEDEFDFLKKNKDMDDK